MHEQGAGMINVTRMLQSSLVITGDLSFIIHETDVYEKNLILKNIGDETIHITITTTNAQNENGDEINVLTVNESVISINPHNTKEISFTLNISEISNDELYVGSVLFQSETDEYRIPYIFDINSELNVKFPNHTPNFIVFDDSLDNWYVNNQYQIGGSSSVFRLKSGNYTVIAVNDFLSQGPIKKNEYIIAKRVEVPFRGVSNVTFNLSDAREFVFEGKSLRGSELKIYDWTKGFAIYSSTNEECNLLSSQGREVCEESPEEHTCRHIPDSNYEYDCIAKGRMYTWGESGSPVALGDRKVYLNNNPSYNAGISIDILAQYMGGIHE